MGYKYPAGLEPQAGVRNMSNKGRFGAMWLDLPGSRISIAKINLQLNWKFKVN